MFDTTQPFTKLVNANIAAFARLKQSLEIPGQAVVDPFFQGAAGLWPDSAKASALVEWSRAVAQNYATFLTEWNRSVYGVFWQGQAFMTGQTREVARNFQQGLDEIVRAEEEAVDAIDVEAETVVSLESARHKKKAV